MKTGLIVGLATIAFLLASGIVATYFGLKRARSADDKVKAIKILTFVWITINFLLVLLLVLIFIKF